MISRRLLRIKAMHLIYAWAKNDDKNIKIYDSNLDKSIESFYELYISFFQLLFDIQHYMLQQIDANKSKYLPTEEELNPNIRFIENPILNAIKESEEFKSLFNKYGLLWQDSPEIIKQLSNQIMDAQWFNLYLTKPEITNTEHKQVLIDILSLIVAESDKIFEFLEDRSIFWNDDIELVISMNIRTIERVKKTYRVKPMKLYKDNEDEEFVKTLFRKTLLDFDEILKLIAQIAKNWELDRIAIMDKIILALAITELRNFPEIPIRATLNEYIDMAKYYSTENSSMFVNGILDKVVSKMKQEKVLNKVDGAIFDRNINNKSNN